MAHEISQSQRELSWPQLIRNCFNFESGQGVVQLDLSHLFSNNDCQEIYQIFNANLNWIIRDGEKLEIPDSQVPAARYMEKTIDFFRCLLQQNIPEKEHVCLALETLRVGRSDGTQHQVGGKWHQDHEAYFTLVINLTENLDPNLSTKFYHLEPNEKYNWDKAGNATPCDHWRESFIKPFHLGILNSGTRYFLFPFDRCRPIIHRAPKLIPNNKRLAIFATISISGIEQGMDLKDVYLPHLNDRTDEGEKASALEALRNHWRNILGIEESIRAKISRRLSKTKFNLYEMQSINLSVFNKPTEKQQGNYSQYRIANFGFRQFENGFGTGNNEILGNVIPIGGLSRALYFFSEVGKFSIKKLMQKNISALVAADCSLSGNNNYDLFVQFRQPEKAFQLLRTEEVLAQIDQFVLILYREPCNYFYPPSLCETFQHKLPFERDKKIGIHSLNQRHAFCNNAAQLFTSLPLNELHGIEASFLLSRSIETAWKRGVRILVNQKGSEYTEFNRNKINKLIRETNCAKQSLRDVDEVPFFQPRTGINRTLQGVNLGSQLIALSRKILSKKFA